MIADRVKGNVRDVLRMVEAEHRHETACANTLRESNVSREYVKRRDEAARRLARAARALRYAAKVLS